MENKPLLQILKIGGNVLDNPTTLNKVLQDFSQLKGSRILVHGGGKSATEFAESTGISPVFVEGRRITDQPMLDIAVMTYAGLLNKQLVSKLQAFGVNAIGLSGADANVIASVKRPVSPIDFGFVGDIENVDGNLIDLFLSVGLTPVFCAITHDGNGQLLNTNADTIAAEIAVACTRRYHTVLNYCFEKKGVLTDPNDNESVIDMIDLTSYQTMKTSGSIHSGMLPKLQNAFNALSNGVSEVKIGGPNMLVSQQFTTLKP